LLPLSLELKQMAAFQSAVVSRNAGNEAKSHQLLSHILDRMA
jgi:hypothetical protein